MEIMWDILTTIHTRAVSTMLLRDTYLIIVYINICSGVFIIMFELFSFFSFFCAQKAKRSHKHDRRRPYSSYIYIHYYIIYYYTQHIHARSGKQRDASPIIPGQSTRNVFGVKGVRKSRWWPHGFVDKFRTPRSDDVVCACVFFSGFKKLITGHLRRRRRDNALHLCDGLYFFSFFSFFLLCFVFCFFIDSSRREIFRKKNKPVLRSFPTVVADDRRVYHLHRGAYARRAPRYRSRRV